MRRNLRRRPSPSLVISIIALVFATTGSAVAAVSFARNAGAVDSKSAFLPRTSLSKVAGDLVATTRSGADRGTIPGKFLDDVMRGGADSFGRFVEVPDNGADVASELASIPGLGRLSASCRDQRPQPGIEDPVSTFTLATDPGTPVNIATQRGAQPPEVVAQPGGTALTIEIGGSNTLRIHAERAGINFPIEIVARQDGTGTNAAICGVYGYALRVTDSGLE